MSSSLQELNAKNFDETIKSSPVPVLVDFWAAWCPPCRALTPTLEEISTELNGKLKIMKVDTEGEGNDALAARFGIRSIPMMLVFKNGELVDQLHGNHEKRAILAKLAPII
jgi:thioredoxin